MPVYQLRVYGVGLLVGAKSISTKKGDFWSKKKTSELTRYIFGGNEDFEEFDIPQDVQFEGFMAEEEEDLSICLSHDVPFDNNIQQIFGPKWESIKRIECIDLSNGDVVLWSEDEPQIQTLVSTDDPDEEVSAYLKTSANNLLLFESEKGCWVYESDSGLGNSLKNLKDLRVLQTNCSFGGDIDSIIDGVCVGFVFLNHFFHLKDVETDNLGAYATIYKDDAM